MADYRQLEEQFSANLGLERRPVAITAMTAVPQGVGKFTGTAPSGCSFWRLASEGRTFYTIPSDHYNCAIGAYTHNIPLPPGREQELPETLGFMTGIGYIRWKKCRDSPVARHAGRRRIRAARRYTSRPRRRNLLRTCGCDDAAAGVRHPRRGGRPDQHARPPDLHVGAGGDGTRNGGQVPDVSETASTRISLPMSCMPSFRPGISNASPRRPPRSGTRISNCWSITPRGGSS